MENYGYYHMYANGDDARNYIVSEADFRTEFNLVAVCAFISKVTVVAFSIEDTHPHLLLFGTYEQCYNFKICFEKKSLRHIISSRGSADNVILDCELLPVNDENHLKNSASYVICQATKDGKPVMPYDYMWGTGSLYFRAKNTIPLWRINDDMSINKVRKFKDLTYREKKMITCSNIDIPDEWEVCNGLILPHNYIDIKRYERIFRTHNCFRTFLSSNRYNDKELMNAMAEIRGIKLDDLEARELLRNECQRMYGKDTARWLNVKERYALAVSMRDKYKLSIRQLSTLCRLPEAELAKYLR